MKPTRAEVQQALQTCTILGMRVPDAFQFVSSGYRQGMTQDQFKAAWPTFSMETQVGLVACLYGRTMHSPVDARVITSAYLALCRGEALVEAEVAA